jgi:hypothetical protein
MVLLLQVGVLEPHAHLNFISSTIPAATSRLMASILLYILPVCADRRCHPRAGQAYINTDDDEKMMRTDLNSSVIFLRSFSSSSSKRFDVVTKNFDPRYSGGF